MANPPTFLSVFSVVNYLLLEICIISAMNMSSYNISRSQFLMVEVRLQISPLSFLSAPPVPFLYPT